MELNRLQKTTKNILNFGLVFQIIYLVANCFILTFPAPLLRMVGLSGNYDLPLDVIGLTGKVLRVALWLVMYVAVMVQVGRQSRIGVGQGIFWWLFLSVTDFISGNIVTQLSSSRLDQFVEEAQMTMMPLTTTLGENITSYNWINAMCNSMDGIFLTAVVLAFVAYGIYCYQSKEIIRCIGR